MRKLFILLVTLLLMGCVGNKSGETINAPGFSGIGDLSIGLTKEEALSLLSGVKADNYIPGFGSSDGSGPVSRYSGTLPLKENNLDLYLTFYRDSLALVEVGKRGGSSSLLRDILTAKYGEGDRIGRESNYSESWRGEIATAVYYYETDNNPDLYKRKTREVVEITQTGRDIRGEISREKEERDSRREEDLRNIW